jgi:hypothetical protein
VLLVEDSDNIEYDLRDEFIISLPAGSVHNTPATPGPGTRTVVDTDGDALSIAGGAASFANPNSVSGDPGYWLDAVSRVAGKYVKTQVTPTATNAVFWAGWDLNQAGPAGAHAFRFKNTATSNLQSLESNTTGPVIGLYSASTSYELIIVLRSAGAYYYAKGGVYARWTLLWVDSSDSTGTVYPMLSDFSAILTSDFVRVPTRTYAPPVLARDSFTRANGALGSTETTGPDGQTATARAWESGGATWAVASNEAVNTPTTTGAELVTNGDMESGDPPSSWTLSLATLSSAADERTGGSGAASIDVARNGADSFLAYQTLTTVVGTWYVIDGWEKRIDTSHWAAITVRDSGGTWLIDTAQLRSTSTSWVQKTGTFRAIGTSTHVRLDCFSSGADGTSNRFDDISVKVATLNELFTDIDDGSTSDYVAEIELDTVVAGTQAGMVLNLDDATTPANFIIGYHDGVNAKLDKCVAGTYTSVISAAAAYAAGAKLKVHKQGTSFELFYNNAKIGSTSTISDSGIISNSKHGMFSTNSGNQLDNFTVNYRTHSSYDEEFDPV